MIVYFGLELDDVVQPMPGGTQGGIHYFGPQGLLFMLESHLGLLGHPSNNDHLRIEQYRQALRAYLEETPDVFYAASFAADQFATATALLNRRDELLLAGWNFEITETIPVRLQVLAAIEDRLRHSDKWQLAAGAADRFLMVYEKLKVRRQPIGKILLNEDWPLLPVYIQKLFRRLQGKGVELQKIEEYSEFPNTDLGVFRRYLSGQDQKGALRSQGKKPLQGDGSLLLLKARRETDLAIFLTHFFRNNPDFRPICLIPEKNRALDNALVCEGLPSMGILSASLARPSLQILKLIPAFLWQPIDPYKILEFVSLALKPLDEELGRRVAQQMARTPGINGEGWFAAISQYFEELDLRARSDSGINVHQIRNQYEFWFERKRYDISQTVPKTEVIEIFNYLAQWAFKTFEDGSGVNHSLLVLSEQAKRITDLLETLPESESQLSNLELERIVRTIYEPSPVQFKSQEKGHLPYFYHNSALIEPVSQLLWWNFRSNEPDHFFSNWYPFELSYLNALGVEPEGPTRKNERLLWQRKRPILQVKDQLILATPAYIEGREMQAHPLFGDLEACFGNAETVTFDIDTSKGRACFEAYFSLPEKITLDPVLVKKTTPFVRVQCCDKLEPNEEETYTSLESLFYYPYQWVFRQKAKLRPSSILSVVNDVTLMGNLAHRFFELLFKQEFYDWSREELYQWIESQAYTLLSREGAVLQLYGREPERVAFINRIKYAAWNLIAVIRSNGWKVLDTELNINGQFLGYPVKAKADLVLRRKEEVAVIDLKWRGSARRERIIRNEEDLQLVMYSRFVDDPAEWAHTAYFIIEDGKLIARNNLAFKEALAVNPESDYRTVNERIWAKMERTFSWRIGQLQSGDIEIRTEHTLDQLEATYSGNLMELLELPGKNAPFDDYRVLIGSIG